MTQSDYYSVCLHSSAGDETYTVYAASDYAAACRVRVLTGRMAESERDVQRLPQRPHSFTTPKRAMPFSLPSGVYAATDAPPRAGLV